MYILLTGPPGIGKSTVLKKFAGTFNPKDLSGFLAEEVLDEKNKRVGFRTVTYPSLNKRTFAHKVCIESKIKIGSYKVKTSAIDESIAEALTAQKAVFLVDEIGRMQSHSDFFMNETKRLFKEKPNMFVVGTIVYEDEPFARYFKKMKDVLVITVTEKNRGYLPTFLRLLFRINIPRSKWREYITKVKPYLREGKISSAITLADIMR